MLYKIMYEWHHMKESHKTESLQSLWGDGALLRTSHSNTIECENIC